MEFEPKQFGKYFLIEKLAVGGMAEIYKAKTYGAEGFEKLLAIKRILPHAAEDKEFIHMLIDEAKLSVLLSHANIVQVYDLGKVDYDYFISMEFIHGVNLRDILYHLREQSKRLPSELAVYVASEVCKGLDYAHRKMDVNNQPLGIVHRDVSPQNVLISYEGEVKIVDFGIAKAAMNMSHTMAGILKGKIAYMSPEQAMGKTVDARTDIFSLGIILYESLTGKKLYTGESQFEVLKKIRTTRIDVGKLPNTIPESLKTIVAKALAYRPEDRFQSAGDMQVALTRFLYATYTDFSPRKLSLFVKDLFRESLDKEKKSLEGPKTGSVSFVTQRPQETIVHRDSVSSKEPRGIPLSNHTQATAEEHKTSYTVSETHAEPKKSKTKLWATLLLITLTSVGGYLAYKNFIQTSDFKTPIAQTGVLQIQSTPTGAEIYMNGELTNLKTPAILNNLELNKDYKIVLSLEAYGRQEKIIRLTNSTPLFLNMSLSKNVGLLNVFSEPSGADILVNGIPTGKITPADLNNLTLNTEYRITLRKTGYEDVEQPITLLNPAPQKLNASLKTKITVVEQGSVVVATEPTGAKIFIDQTDSGKVTPAKIDGLTIGKSYQIRLEKENFQPLSKMIALIDKTPISITEKLTAIIKEVVTPTPTPPSPPPPVIVKPKPKIIESKKPVETPLVTKPVPASGTGNIRVSSNPSGAEVFINGEQKGQTPMTLQANAGAVRILITKGSETLPCKKNVQVQPNQTIEVACELGTMFGKIEINTIPPRANVYLDGKLLGGKTPMTIKQVQRDDEHTIRVELDGFKPWSRSFDLREGTTKSFNIELER